MKAIFDGIAIELTNSVREQISNLERSSPYEELRYIILSGGLGSSEYIKRKVIAGIYNAAPRLMGRDQVQVIVAPDPQLAVAKGLVMDRSQTLSHDITVWAGRCCRVSYGIICKYLYNSKEHFGEPNVKDPVSGQLWVQDQIEWIIKEVSHNHAGAQVTSETTANPPNRATSSPKKASQNNSPFASPKTNNSTLSTPTSSCPSSPKQTSHPAATAGPSPKSAQ